MEFKLRGEFIELDNMLKALGLVENGAAAKQCIQCGSVKVNSEAETRIRRKLKAGDVVEFAGKEVKVIS